MFHFLVSQAKTPPYPTQDCTGKTIIVTGANVGLGLEAARHFVRLGAAKVILGCRDVEKGEVARADIEATATATTAAAAAATSTAGAGVEATTTTTTTTTTIEVWQVDLASFASVKEFCRRADGLERLDAVVENAGIAPAEHAEFEGYERTITVNVISTFLMALLMLPVLRKSAVGHGIVPNLVIVSSDAHFGVSLSPLLVILLLLLVYKMLTV